MSSLKDFVIPQVSVGVPGTDFKLSVGALSFADIVGVFVRHKPIVADLYLRFSAMGEGDKKQELKAAIGTLVSEAPDIVALVIAIANGNGNDVGVIETAKRLPFPVQTEALQAIGMLTFGRLEDDAVKKFFTTVTDALVVVRQMMDEGSAALQAGSAAFEKT